MAEPTISKMDSYQYPSAHLGHLTESQQAALEKFKAICGERKYYHPAGKDGRKYPSHDDETMLRYLRARKFDPEQGFTQFKDTEEWRKENRLEEYYETVDINEYEAARKLYPQWTGRRDKRGIPLYLFEVAHLNSKTINAYQASLVKDKSPPINPKSKVEPKMMRLFALYESLTRFIFPLCSAIKNRPHPETPVSQSNNIVDISRVGLRQFWNLKSHMQDASTLATAHYPETLDRIFIIGAPSFFPTVWSWIKRWFDPITVSKIFILSPQDMLPTLTKYIELENIPRKYGGGLNFEFGNSPVLDPAITNALSFSSSSQTFPIGPIKWRELPNGTLQAIAVGTDAGKKRDEVIATIRTDFTMIHGISRQNTAVDWSHEPTISTSGTATQPPEGDPDYGRHLAEADSGTATPTSAAGAPPVDLAVRAKGHAAPHGDPSAAGANIQPASDATPRKGTSAVKAEQQAGTHAEGVMEEKTPHVVDLGGGDKAAVVETLTVGQARKDTQIPEPPKEEGKGLVAQATDVVSGAAGAVSAGVGAALHAVGLTGEKEQKVDPELEKERAEREKAKDGIDVPDEKVEEYLKNQSLGRAPPSKK